MKSDKYGSKLNGTTVFVKDYSASVRMHDETPNTSISPYHKQITPNHRSHKSLVMNSCKEKNYSPGRVTRNSSSRNG